MSIGTYEVASLQVEYLSQYSRPKVWGGCDHLHISSELEICAFCGAIDTRIQSKSSMRADPFSMRVACTKNGPESN